MRPILDLINNNFFKFEPIEATDWEVVKDLEQVENQLFSQYWQTLKNENHLAQNSPEKEEDWAYIQKDIHDLLKKKKYSQWAENVEFDLWNCHLNIKNRLKHPLWNQIFKAYKKGVFPCGWQGEFPEGKLVVFHPKYKPSEVEKLQKLAENYFEILENLPQKNTAIEELIQLFSPEAEIHTDSGDEAIGTEQIRQFYQKIMTENKQTKYLWQKQRTNNKNYFEVRFGLVAKTINGAIKSETKTLSFDIKKEKINRIEIVK